MRRFFENQMKKYDITTPQFEALLILWDEDGLRLNELGRRLSRDGPTITGLIDRMEKKQLLKRKRDARDRRTIHVLLTPKAWGMKEDLMRLQQESLKDIAGSLSSVEIEQFANILAKIHSNIEQIILPKMQNKI
jgi:DNA-binding MarR family transcriptional regulator